MVFLFLNLLYDLETNFYYFYGIPSVFSKLTVLTGG